MDLEGFIKMEAMVDLYGTENVCRVNLPIPWMLLALVFQRQAGIPIAG